MLVYKRIKLSKTLIKLLKIYFNKDYEVGGILFAHRKGLRIVIDTLSFKKGNPFSIDFDDKDVSLFEVPTKHVIIGTWHTHPFQQEVSPSSIDLEQWDKWKKRYIHLIYNGEEIKIFTSKGEVLYVGKS